MVSRSHGAQISRLVIEGLWGDRTVDIPVKDNRLVLVGENGIGKSTVVNILFHLLTCRFERLRNYGFKRVTLYLKSPSTKISISAKDLIDLNWEQESRLFDRTDFPPSMVSRVVETVRRFVVQSDRVSLDELVERISHQIHAPRSLIYHIAREYVGITHSRSAASKTLREAAKAITQLFPEQILYLPTYRRIERDLQYILPKLGRDPESVMSEISQSLRGPNYLELVEFGMRDVEQAIAKTLEQQKEFLRKNLADLTGQYLREALHNFPNVNIKPILELDEDTISSILRWTRDLLGDDDRRLLSKAIQQYRSGSALPAARPHVAHFITMLVSVHRQLREQEGPIQRFIHSCNKYLTGKKMYYNSISFELGVREAWKRRLRTKEERKIPSRPVNPDRQLPLSALSSGEKQIVSLFSHLFLSGVPGYVVIIDEPELSLSMPWQKEFLPDIWNTGMVGALIAVTHSPFIFENEFQAHTHSLREFIR